MPEDPGKKSRRRCRIGAAAFVGPYPESKEHIGGFAVVDVPSREAALEWAAKIAAACRCAQQVFEILPPPSERWDWAREEYEEA